MMRSMYAGVSGLKVHQTKMDVIGNNIANVNTTAYKTQSVTFSELMYQTTQSASGPNATTGTAGVNAKQIGLGVKAGAISTAITSAGSSQTTGNPFDIKITGDSFFIASDGTNNYFTRDGSFYVDAAGNLAMTSTGYNVMGWQVDEETGLIKQDTVSALRIMNAANLTYPPEATSKAYISGIVDMNDTDVTSESGKVMNLNFFDNLGYDYTAKLSIHGTAPNGQYYLQIDDVINAQGTSLTEVYGAALSDIVSMGSIANVKVSETMALATQQIDGGGSVSASYDQATQGVIVTKYDADGNIDGTPRTYTKDQIISAMQDPTAPANLAILQEIYGSGITADITELTYDENSGKATILAKNVIGGIVKYDTNTGYFADVNGQPTITIDFKESVIKNPVTDPITGNVTGETESLFNFSDVEIDMTKTSMFDHNGSSTIGAKTGDLDGRGAGRALGTMSSIAIANDGTITASYSNGMSRTLGQIAVAEFTNPAGLEKKGDNLYAATQNSGEFDGIGIDVMTSSGSYMTTGVLEMSNVDLSTEFTEMITTQRGFQANSRIITTSDSMLEELVNLKR